VLAGLTTSPLRETGEGEAARRAPCDLDRDGRGPRPVVERDGSFAGTHLIIDLWHASGLDDVDVIEKDRTNR